MIKYGRKTIVPQSLLNFQHGKVKPGRRIVSQSALIPAPDV
jgi:hypothetical protein